MKLEESTRANHEIGPRVTGPAGRLDTAGRLYVENASKMARACTETQAGRVSGKNAAAEAPGHAIKLGVSTRANHEIGPRSTGPAGRLDTAGRLYAKNASKMARACTETQAGRVSGKNAAAEAQGHAIKLGVSTRAHHEIGQRATGPVGSIDTAGRLYTANASKMA